ncbi:hypothetical protein O181_055809 [Austropuccinia psidii MF-1]|uniref:Uncharacterized protein n=1 Tax=Austropuccinia psidii MF-1 TaxID=1389203 RepID=A0A9Q3E7E2_9BASI|nr:hypothetical protein [Austropuccinia psidii MF-1]
MGEANSENFDDDQDPIKEFLVEDQEDAQLKIEEIQLEEGLTQDTENKNLLKHTQYSQTFLVTPTKGMAYIHGTVTKITVCVYNAHHPLIIQSGANFSLVDRKYLDKHLPNWEKQLLPNKAKNLKSASGKLTSISIINKEMKYAIERVISE